MHDVALGSSIERKFTHGFALENAIVHRFIYKVALGSSNSVNLHVKSPWGASLYVHARMDRPGSSIVRKFIVKSPRVFPLYVSLYIKQLWGAPQYVNLHMKSLWRVPFYVNLRMNRPWEVHCK